MMSIKIASWEDVDDILFDGTSEEISQLYCPECKGKLTYDFSKASHIMNICCTKCGIHIRENCGKNIIPNFVNN